MGMFDKHVSKFRSSDRTEDEDHVVLTVEVPARVAANIEALETCFYRWKEAHKKGDEVGENRALEKAREIGERDMQAMAIHAMRPPHLFEKSIKTLM